MTHTITATHDHVPGVRPHMNDQNDVPAVSKFGNEPVLTVTGVNGRRVSFLFNDLTGAPGVVVHPWRIDLDDETAPPNSVRIQGEDLYALRELLNEMPEEAFVRPAEPVKAPVDYGFKPGDVIVCTAVASSYTRDTRGTWHRVSKTDGPTLKPGQTYDDEWAHTAITDWAVNYRKVT